MPVELVEQVEHIGGQAVSPCAKGGAQCIADAFIRLRHAYSQKAAISACSHIARPAHSFALHFHVRTTGVYGKSFWLSVPGRAIASS